MSSFVESFLTDALKHEKIQSSLKDLLWKLFDILSPYLLAIAVVLGGILIGIVAILVLLIQRGGGGV
jgi:hypothetical protein